MGKILNFKVIATTLFIIVMILFFWHSTIYPSCCDTDQYLYMGESYSIFNTIIMPSNYSGLRLYGYPLFISIFYKIIPNYVILGIFITQLILYISVSHFIAKAISKKFNSTYKYIFYSLLFNILLLPYLVIPLSDALSVIVWLAIALIIIKIFIEDSDVLKNKELIYFFLLGLFVGFSIMVRPSNIHLIVILIVTLLMRNYLFKKPVIFTSIGFMIAILPQIYINYKVFGSFSFLPNVNLGDLQVQWGIENIKYATNLSGIGTAQLFYKNPFYLNSEIANLNWYFFNPIEGIKTIFLHIFGALSFDYLFPYIYDLEPKYQNLLLFYSSLILFFGIYGYIELIKILWKVKENKINKNLLSILFIVIPVVILGWIGIIGLSAVENRFSLPIMTLLMPFAFYGFHYFVKNINIKVLFLLIGYLIAAWLLSDFISMNKIIY